MMSLCAIFALLATANPSKKKIIFFGDSITEAGVQADGYITKMQASLTADGLDDKADLIGKGIGGNKVYDLYLRMQEDVIALKPDIVFIYIGVNDVWHKQSHGTGTDADKFVRFYQAIIDTMQSRNIDLILVTPGVIGEKIDYSNTLDGDLNQYSKLIADLASKNGTGLIDLRAKMLVYNKKHNSDNSEKGILTYDRVHLNSQGNALVAETFLEALRSKM